MATGARTAVSQILRNKDDVGEEEEEPKKKSREDWRKAKELEEARKAGTAPAAVDETGMNDVFGTSIIHNVNMVSIFVLHSAISCHLRNVKDCLRVLESIYAWCRLARCSVTKKLKKKNNFKHKEYHQ